MDPFAELNPWLITAAVLFVGFVLGRMSKRDTSEGLRHHEASARRARAQFAGLDEDDRREIRDLLAKGRKINAIKLHRELTGSGLKESKEFVETLAER